MRAAAAAPTGQERRLGPDELIVSKTDTKGIITYANDVFCRFAALPEQDLIGQPHNVIRHPDMPRCIFKLLWDTLGSREEVFAYVVNLAADGTHYWVLAHVTPTMDRSGQVIGYHSNRRCPDRTAIASITGLYAALRAEERRHQSPSQALAASSAMLADRLGATGLNYDEFFWSVTP